MKRPKWETYPLGELVTMKSGGTPSRENNDFWGGDIPWFSGKDLKTIYLSDSIEHITSKAVESGARLVPAGALLVLIRGMMLMNEVPVGILRREAAFNQDVKALLPKNGSLDVRYLAYFLRAENARIRNLVTTAGHGTGRLPIEALAEYPILCPPLSEQERIADILSIWDEASETITTSLVAKRRRKMGIMQDLLSGKKRITGSTTKWITAQLGELFTERVEQYRDDLPLLSITGDRGVVPRGDLAKRDTSSEDKSKYLRIAPGDIGYNTMRMWQGVSALSALEGIVSPAYTIVSPTDRIDGRFAAHFFKFRHTVHLFHRYSQGLVDDTLNLKFPHFSKIEVTIPSDLNEQKKIANILDLCDQEVSLVYNQREALDRQKRGLMQRLFTGQTRVKL